MPPGGTFDLGNRIIDIHYTPGHTPECVSFYDRNENILFSGDWFTEALGVFAPSSSMGENLSSLESTAHAFPPSVRIFPAHKYVDGGGAPQPLSHQDGLYRLLQRGLGCQCSGYRYGNSSPVAISDCQDRCCGCQGGSHRGGQVMLADMGQ